MLCGVCLILPPCVAADGLIPWNLKALSNPPKVYDAPESGAPDVKAIFYDGLPWKGKPTRVFAYYGIPKVEPGKKVPAMVLVHGGGGSAYIPWVQLWVSRGYAAISMDTCGAISNGGHSGHPHHDAGGPPGGGGFEEMDLPVADVWNYHAVADIILAHSLIRSFPEVDPERTGITGISWGGYLTCITAGVDTRFKFAAPVYGCGFLGESSGWLETFQKMGPTKSKRWLQQWDPSIYLPRVTMPMLWVTGTNDHWYPMDSLQKSYRLPKSPRTLSVRVRMPHGHGGAGENPDEIRAFADSVLKAGTPLATVGKTGSNGADAWVEFESKTPIVKAELNYTSDRTGWNERVWNTIPATLDPTTSKVTAAIPDGTSVYYFNLIDGQNLVVSSEHVELPLKK